MNGACYGFILPCSILVENRTWSEYDSPEMNWFWLQQRRSVNKSMPNGKRIWWRWRSRWRFACAMFAARTGWPFMQSEQWNKEIGNIIWITSNNSVWHQGALVCERFPFKRWVFVISVEKRQWRIQFNHLISLQILSVSEICAENWIDFTLRKAPVRMPFWSAQSRNFVVRSAKKSLQIFQSPEHYRQMKNLLWQMSCFFLWVHSTSRLRTVVSRWRQHLETKAKRKRYLYSDVS